MRLATFEHQNRIRVGALKDQALVPLDILAPDMLTLIDGGASALTEARRLCAAAQSMIPLAEARLLAPIPRARKNIFAVGRNYAEHAKESAAARGEKVGATVIFTKAPTTVNAPFGDLVIDPTVSEQIDWEVELGVVIGKRARKILEADALDYVFGYTVLNDVSARDLQNRTTQFFVGKSLDGYCPMGPWIVTSDEIPDPQNLNLQCSVNGVLKQTGHTSAMIYTVAFVIADLARTLTLEPGDIIATGTPAGVGFARIPPEFLHAGDLLESKVEHIGTLRNPVVNA